MGEILDALHKIQDVELKLSAIRRGCEDRVRRVQVHKKNAQRVEEQIDAKQRGIRELQMRLDALSLDVASREQSITKHREALNRAKTNKEYASILAAMNTEKADNTKLESQIIEMMDQLQAEKTALDSLKEDLARHLQHVETASQTVREYERQREREVQELEARRERLAEAVPPTAIAGFNRVAEHHDGEAMVPIVRLHPKRQEFGCGGCNMKVTLETVNSLRTRDDIQTCNVCGRILYLEPAASERSSVR